MTRRGVLVNSAWNDGDAQSLGPGVYSSHICEMTTNMMAPIVPSMTARLAALRPWFSLRMSVIRKVLANSTLPRGISMQKASTKISTSMFARMVAITLKAYRPAVPAKR